MSTNSVTVEPISWFEPVEPATEWFDVTRVAPPARPVTEGEHQAALAEIDLPPHPLELELRPSPWPALAHWAAGTLQIALGATVGALAVLVALAWIVQMTR